MHRERGQVIFTKILELPFMPVPGITIVYTDKAGLEFHIEISRSDFRHVWVEYDVGNQICNLSISEVGRFYDKEYLDDYIDHLRGLGWDCSEYDKIYPAQGVTLD